VAGLLELEQFMAPFVPVLQHLQAFFAQVFFVFFCFTLVTGPRRSLSLTLSDTRVAQVEFPPLPSPKSTT